MGYLITKQVCSTLVNDVIIYLTYDPYRFSRMEKKYIYGSYGIQIVFYDETLQHIKRIVADPFFIAEFPEYSKEIKAFTDYIDSGEPLWCEI